MSTETAGIHIYRDHLNAVPGTENLDDTGTDYDRPTFTVTKSPNKMLCWVCENASPSLHKLVEIMLHENRYDHPDYCARLKASPFFQSGSDRKDGYILLEFWTSEVSNALEYVHYLEGRWLGVCEAKLIAQLPS